MSQGWGLGEPKIVAAVVGAVVAAMEGDEEEDGWIGWCKGLYRLVCLQKVVKGGMVLV